MEAYEVALSYRVHSSRDVGREGSPMHELPYALRFPWLTGKQSTSTELPTGCLAQIMVKDTNLLI